MSQWWLIACIIFLIVISMLATIVFCFWFIYLLDTIHRKWEFYRNTKRDIQQGHFDAHNQILAYNAKTEFVKYQFLFCMNILEWMAIVLTFIAHIENSIQKVHHFEENITDHTINTHGKSQSNLSFVSYLFSSSNDCFIMCLII